MTTEKISIAHEFFSFTAREASITGQASGAQARAGSPSAPRSPSTPRRILSAFVTLITVGSDVMAEAHQLRSDAARRYPHLTFDA